MTIEEAHTQAIQLGKDFYQDPKTGYWVCTRAFLARRGECCGSGCRHCPYSESNPTPHEQVALKSCAS